MDFGLQLAGMPADQLVALARRAEDHGFRAIYVPDHLAHEPPGTGTLDDQTPSWEAMTMLGALAQATSEVRIGGHVLCNLLRHPGVTALATSTLDHLSGGRAVLGIGAGWTRNEFEMMGLPYPEIQPRLRMLDEALTIIKSLWTESRTTFSGEFYRLEDAISVPKPLQDPHPPIVLGGSGKGLLRIAARHADVVNVIVDIGRAGTVLASEIGKLTEEEFKAKLDFVRREARAAGRDPILSTTLFVLVITDSPEATVQTAAAIGAGFGLDPQHALRMPIALVGTPDECIAELERREREWGLGHLIVSTAGGADTVDRFAREVMSHL